jgi:tetratricopeptide (TPR) repeat protein
MRTWSLYILVALASTASAQPAKVDPNAKTEADQLFVEGLALIDAGKPDEACAKFEQSLAKDPRAVGTLLNLGRCNEQRGRVATAVSLYREALDRATEANKLATQRQLRTLIDALEPKVPHLTIKRAAPPLPGEKLLVDDEVVPADSTSLTLDPGKHTVVDGAPGRLPYETTVELEIGGHSTLELPALRVPTNTEVTRTRSTRRAIGKLTTFAGVGIALAGAGLLYYAHHDYDKLFEGENPHCGAFPEIDGASTCDAYGQSRSERDVNLASAGLIIGGLGLAAATTGVIMWWTAPEDTTRLRVTPVGGPTTAGVSVSGRF